MQVTLTKNAVTTTITRVDAGNTNIEIIEGNNDVYHRGNRIVVYNPITEDKTSFLYSDVTDKLGTTDVTAFVQEIISREYFDISSTGGGGSNDASDLTQGVLDDARVQESNVTQHEDAITITKSQISDLGTLSGSNTGDQDISISGNDLTISGGSTVTLPSGGSNDASDLTGVLDDDVVQESNVKQFEKSFTVEEGQVNNIKDITLEYHVATTGDGTNDGSYNSPFSNIIEARDAIRAYKVANGSLPKGTTVVWVHGGEYNINSGGYEFTSDDAGTKDSPIIYKSWNGETVKFSGGVNIDYSDVVVPEQAYIDRIIDAGAKTAVRKINLGDLGLTINDKGVYRVFAGGGATSRLVDGSPVPYPNPEGKLYIDDNRLTYSRYPKIGEGPDSDGYLRIASEVSNGWVRRDGNTTGTEGGSFTYDDEALDNIVADGNPVVRGYYGVTYSEVASHIDTLDPSTNTIQLLEDSWYGINYENDALSEVRFMIDNTLEFIKDENEIFVDENTGDMLFIPPTGFGPDSTIKLSLSENTAITLTNCDYVTFDGIDVELNRLKAIDVVTSDNVKFLNTDISYVEGHGLETDNNDIFDVVVENLTGKLVGRSPLTIGGGNKLAQTEGRCYARNIKFEEFGEPINLRGVGTKLINFELDGTDGIGITFNGTNLEIGYGIISNAVRTVSDFGVIYGGRDFAVQGTWIHDLLSLNNQNGLGGTGTQFIYADDYLSNVLVERVIGWQTGSGVQIALFKGNQGTDHVVRNCISWGRNLGYIQVASEASWQARFVDQQFIDKLANVDYPSGNSRFNIRYPKVKALFEANTQPDLSRNIFEDNLVYNSTVVKGIKDGSYVDVEGTGVTNINNDVINYNPGFADPDNGDFRISKQAWESDPYLAEREYIDVTRMGYLPADKLALNSVTNEIPKYSIEDIGGDIPQSRVTDLESNTTLIQKVLNNYFGSSDTFFGEEKVFDVSGTTVNTDEWTLSPHSRVDVQQNDGFVFEELDTSSGSGEATARSATRLDGAIDISARLEVITGRFPSQYMKLVNPDNDLEYVYFWANNNFSVVTRERVNNTTGSSSDTGIDKDDGPYYYRIVYNGSDTVTYYTSADGITWDLHQEIAYTFTQAPYIEFSQTHYNGQGATSKWDEIKLTRGSGISSLSDETLTTPTDLVARQSDLDSKVDENVSGGITINNLSFGHEVGGYSVYRNGSEIVNKVSTANGVFLWRTDPSNDFNTYEDIMSLSKAGDLSIEGSFIGDGSQLTNLPSSTPSNVNQAFKEVTYSASVSETYDVTQPNFYIDLDGDITLALSGITSGGGVVNLVRASDGGSETITLTGVKSGNHDYPVGADKVVRLSYFYENGELVWYCNNPVQAPKAKLVSFTSTRDIAATDIDNTILCTSDATLNITADFNSMEVGDSLNLFAKNAELTIDAAGAVTINDTLNATVVLGGSGEYVGSVLVKIGTNEYIIG